jgi:predicted MFS family arabinose efflux permease
VTVSLAAIALGASPFTVGVLVSLFAVVPMVAAVSMGRLVDRVGVRGPLAAAAAVVAAGLVLAFALPTLPTLFAASPLIGTGFMLLHVAVNHAAGVMGTAAERIRNFSILALGFSTSGFLGPILAGYSIDALGHWRTFLALAAFPALGALAVAVPRVPLPAAHPRAVAPTGRNAFELLADPALRRILVVSAISNMTWDLFTFLIPIYGTGIGLAASDIGLVLGAFGAAIFLVRMALPLLARRVREWNLLLAALLIACASHVAIPLVGYVPLLMALGFVLGAGLGMSQPLVMSLLYNAAPTGRAGEAVGLRTTFLTFSQTFIPLASGALGAAFGMLPVFWMMAAVLAAGAAIARRSADAGGSTRS